MRVIQLKNILSVLVLTILIVGCKSQNRLNKNINYFQTGQDSIANYQYSQPIIQPYDLLSIQVFSESLNQEQVALFNLPNRNSSGTSNSSSSGAAYQVDSSGKINMPILGNINVIGLTRLQLEKNLEQKLYPFVKNPNVIVKFDRFKVNVLGEVKIPGVKDFITDRATILDAIAMSGDLTDFAKREDVLLIREKDKERKIYHLNLLDTKIFNSKAFQLQQNDLIIVNANDIKLKQLNINPNFQRDFSIGLSIISVAALLLNTISIINR